MDFVAKGQDLVAKANKRLSSFSLFGGGSKYEDAAEMYEKAANQFKLGKACELRAGRGLRRLWRRLGARQTLRVGPLPCVALCR